MNDEIKTYRFIWAPEGQRVIAMDNADTDVHKGIIVAMLHHTTLFNYAGLRTILEWAALASEKFRSASLGLSKAASGVLAKPPRWQECVRTVSNVLPEIVGYRYVQQKFSVEAKKEVEDLVKRIADVFNETIRGNEWMDNATKRAAESKLAKMAAKIGYPSWLLNMTYLEELYKYVPQLHLSSSFLEMYYAILKNNWMRTLVKLGRPFDQEAK
ncbi:membrane metallo-endopeptidase-like 1 [Dermacentor andersoni]|uniref:membrane metallo-endopeptidase-like 1 n=1 Tax=Dermacentor andersoni TaxID=34620 RepID=UPI00241708FA|nr:membrane metallo-endopeptidase-like 1 [Dermacentor andersoni]